MDGGKPRGEEDAMSRWKDGMTRRTFREGGIKTEVFLASLVWIYIEMGG